MWLAHYSFHLLTSCDTVVPTAQRFFADLGWSALGQPHWVSGCCRAVGDWLPRLEILFLDLGLLLSLYSWYRIALAQSPVGARSGDRAPTWASPVGARSPDRAPTWALRVFAPWALLNVLLFAAGVWIVLQPMQMRGTMFAAGEACGLCRGSLCVLC